MNADDWRRALDVACCPWSLGLPGEAPVSPVEPSEVTSVGFGPDRAEIEAQRLNGRSE